MWRQFSVDHQVTKIGEVCFPPPPGHREIRTFELFIPVKRFAHLAFCYRLACLLLSCRLPTFTKRFLYRWRKFSSLFQPSVFYTFVLDFLVLEANGSEDIQSLGKTNGFSETLWANHSWKEVCIILPYLDSSIFFEFYNKFLFLRCFSVQVLVFAHGLKLCKLFCSVIVSIPELFFFAPTSRRKRCIRSYFSPLQIVQWEAFSLF